MSQEVDPLASTGTQSSAPTSELAFLHRIARGESGPGAGASRCPPESGDWAGSRFTIGRRLGVGGFGAVYEAFDHQRQARVALKTVMRQDSTTLYRFKREFRSLTDLVHPNLVELYELHGDDARWFFTMELVRGVDLNSALRSAGAAGIRAALQQLAEGLCFLHEAGRLHRDIKPSNVLVDGDGRVVLLDFGLVVDLADTTQMGTAGTPRYMPPEIFTGPIGPAIDWYAVGVLLYEVLASRPPFEGPYPELIHLKATSDPPPLLELAPEAPDDLRQLCHDLLRRDPAARPTGREVLERLTGLPSDRAALRDINIAASVFVGRATELEQLRAAFECARAGRTAVALVHAAPGMGKTALVTRYLADLRVAVPDTVVLAGRCFEQESVPYQALDSLVDDLGRYLARLPFDLAQALAPPDIATLLTLFPSLRPALRSVSAAVAIPDKVEARRRAVLAFGELLARVAARAPLVLWIDDLHWGDQDGGALLVDLLARADAPPLLLIVGFRSDEAERSACLRLVLPALRAGHGLERWELELQPLAEEDARGLAERALDGFSSSEVARADVLARESGGSPLLLRELCHYVRDTGAAAAMPVSTIGAMITARVAALPEDARRLLEAVALAGQRIERGVAGAASQIGDRELAAVGLLRRGAFVRTSSGRAGEEIEAGHDRIREVVVAGLAHDARINHHRGLARALASTGRAEPELLASHLEGAGERAEAARHWAEAAEQAFTALALERAARLYRQALEAHTAAAPDPVAVRRLRVRLGETLGHAGRSAEAATVYIEASTDAEPTVSTGLRRLALEHYLWSGNVDEGFGVLGSVLAATGLTMPRFGLGVGVRALGRMFWFQLRGVQRRPSAAADTPLELARLDVAMAAGESLGMLDPMRAIYFHLCSLELALRSRDSFRLLRVLTTELAVRAAIRGSRPPTRTDRQVEQLVQSVYAEMSPTDPRLAVIDGALALSAGTRHWFRGEYVAACVELERAQARLVESPLKISNWLSMTRTWLAYALYCAGAWRHLAEHVTGGLAEARQRGDRFGEQQLGQWGMLFELIADRPEAAAAAVARYVTNTPRSDRSRDMGGMTDRAMLALYRDAGVGDEARRVFEAESGLGIWLMSRLVPHLDAATSFSRGGAYLAAAAALPEYERPLRVVERLTAKLEHLPTPFATPMVAALRAGVAARRGEKVRAEALLVEAEASFTRLGMAVNVAAVQRRRGELMGGEAGARLIIGADQALAAEGIRNPARMVSMILPGRW